MRFKLCFDAALHVQINVGSDSTDVAAAGIFIYSNIARVLRQKMKGKGKHRATGKIPLSRC